MRLFDPPAIETVAEADASERIKELIAFIRSGRDRRAVIERDGKPIAALISYHDLERFDRLLEQREKDFAILERIGEKFADVPDEEIEREAAKAVAEARAELRAKREQEALMKR